MSARTSRSRVSEVSGTVASAATVGGAMLAATLIGLVVRSLSTAARGSLRTAPNSEKLSDTIKSISTLRVERKRLQKQAAPALFPNKHSALESARISVMSSIAATPYLVQDNTALRRSIAAVENASTISDLRRAERALLTTVENTHHQLFVQALTLACRNASLKVGFNSIQTMPAVIENTMRVIATDPAGHALITEITADLERETTIETEVVGVTDASCNQILDAFDKALEEAGVRAAPPKRKYTGGVCELAAARDFIRRKAKRRTRADADSVIEQSASGARRSQRLNASRTQKQR